MSALVQQTQEWLDFRKKMIGASDAPIIMEVSPWKTSHQLWLEKLDLIPSTSQSSAMKRGVQLESVALARFCIITGLEMAPKVMLHPSISYMMASMDGITSDGKHAVEIKCVGKKDHDLAAQGKIPEKYYPQLQHQMEVCGLDKMHYFSFSEDSHFLIEVQRDEEYLKTLLKREEEFYQCLQSFVAPKCDDVYVIRCDDIWSTLAKDWLDTKKQLAALERREDVLRESLSAMAGDHSTKGAGVRVSKATRKGVIDYTKIPQLGGIDLEPYRKESVVYWKITTE